MKSRIFNCSPFVLPPQSQMQTKRQDPLYKAANFNESSFKIIDCFDDRTGSNLRRSDCLRKDPSSQVQLDPKHSNICAQEQEEEKEEMMACVYNSSAGMEWLQKKQLQSYFLELKSLEQQRQFVWSIHENKIKKFQERGLAYERPQYKYGFIIKQLSFQIGFDLSKYPIVVSTINDTLDQIQQHSDFRGRLDALRGEKTILNLIKFQNLCKYDSYSGLQSCLAPALMSDPLQKVRIFVVLIDTFGFKPLKPYDRNFKSRFIENSTQIVGQTRSMIVEFFGVDDSLKISKHQILQNMLDVESFVGMLFTVDCPLTAALHFALNVTQMIALDENLYKARLCLFLVGLQGMAMNQEAVISFEEQRNKNQNQRVSYSSSSWSINRDGDNETPLSSSYQQSDELDDRKMILNDRFNHFSDLSIRGLGRLQQEEYNVKRKEIEKRKDQNSEMTNGVKSKKIQKKRQKKELQKSKKVGRAGKGKAQH